jgi:endoglucanase
VSQGGIFDLQFRVSRGSAGTATFQLQTGNSILDTITVDYTGGWEIWQTKTVRINLATGIQTLKLKALGGNWNINWFEGKSVIVASHVLPGKIEAETYSSQSGVSSLGSAEVGEGRYIGNVSAGDYIDYNVNVQQGGVFDLTFSLSRGSTGTATFQVSSGSTILDTIEVTNTGGWEVWVTKTIRINLPTGIQILKLKALGGSWNLNWFEGTQVIVATHTLPGRIEAETYTSQSGVSRLGIAEIGEGRYIGNISVGDYVTYNVNVEQGGAFDLLFRVSKGSSGTGIFQVSWGSTILDTIVVSYTGGWEVWETKQVSVNLPIGIQILKLEALGGSWNLNWLEGNPIAVANSTLISTPSNARTYKGQEEERNGKILVYPNPAQSSLHVVFQAEYSSKAQVRLVNSLGVLYNRETFVIEGENHMDLNVDLLTSGSYILEIVQGVQGVAKRRVLVIK